MIESLKKRFVTISMAALTIVMITISLIIMMVTYFTINSNIDNLADFIMANDGEFPQKIFVSGQDIGFDFSEESRFETRYFTLKYKNDELIYVNLDSIAEISYEEAITYADTVMNMNRNRGYYEQYKYLKNTKDGITTIVFLNSKSLFDVMQTLLRTIVGITLIGLILLYIIVNRLSEKTIKPFVDNMTRQRQFVADAGHEIKTPLAVISANVDVMEMIDGESEWSQGIKDQIYRLDGLIKNLLKLANMEDIPKDKKVADEVDLSTLVKSSCEEFKVLAEHKHKSLEWQVEDNIVILGLRDKLDELLSLLIENATKYALENTVIDVKLYKIRKSIYITVENSCVGLDGENIDNLFDRFYRGDESHNNEVEGYGIGLSVARAIVESHKGKISAKLLDDGRKIRFMVVL